MKIPTSIICPYCKVAMVSQGVVDLRSGVPGLPWPFGVESFHTFACGECGKVEFFLHQDSSRPAPMRHDRKTWTCECGRVNAGADEYCLNCGDLRTYDVE